MEKIFRFIVEGTNSGKIDKLSAIQIIKMLKENNANLSENIAIIGMALRLPLANDINEYWGNIKGGLDCITGFPECRKKDIDNYLKFSNMTDGEIKYSEGAYIDTLGDFDHKFFKLTPKESDYMDPGQKLFMEVVWHAIEDAGYGGERIVGSKTGVYLGYAASIKDSYQKMIYEVDPASVSESIAANLAAIMPSRISYLLDLKGPSMVIDTACSSSLVAVHEACQALRNGECEMAVAGGLKVHMIPLDSSELKLGIESSDGRTRAFDDSSDGSGIGDGVIAILLKPLGKALKDRDNIYAVIKGSAINQDGKSMGITAPNPDAQTQVIIEAWQHSNIDPVTIGYIETHGTGTTLGDPIEIQGLQNAFLKYTTKKQFCAIGSVKSNMGHLYECSGLANLVKGTLALKYGEIPKTIYFNKPNWKISFEESPVYVNTQHRKWKTEGHPKRCGISSFGFSGTNCHMVLEEHIQDTGDYEDKSENNKPLIFTLSAKSETALKNLIGNYTRFIEKNRRLKIGDICHTACTGREHHNIRLAIVVESSNDFVDKINLVALRELKDINESWFYFGEHRIIPDNKRSREQGELTRNEMMELNSRAFSKVHEYTESSRFGSDKLHEICELYIKGSSIPWIMMYESDGYKKVSLPVYPFERSRSWIDIPDDIIKSTAELKQNHMEQKIELKPKKLFDGDIKLTGKENEGYTGTEKRVGQIMGELLGFHEIYVYDNFFELGVDSISMMKIVSRISEIFGVEISFNVFAQGIDVVKLSEMIDSCDASIQKSAYAKITPDPDNMYEPFPLTEVQFAYLMGRGEIFEMGSVSTHAYIEVETHCDIERLNIAARKLIKHHPMLRAIILPDGMQKILKDVPDYSINVEDLRHFDEESQKACILKERERMSHFVFVSDQWPLFEAKALRISDDTHYLFIGLDLLIADGASIQIINQQLMKLYNDPEFELPTAELSFRDYVLAYEGIKQLDVYKKDKEYWLDKLEDFPAAPALPLKNEPSSISKPHFMRYSKIFDKNSWDAVKKKARQHNVTTSALLCTAYAQVLAYWSNQPRMAINLAAYNRYPLHEDIDKIIGDFTSVMLLDVNLKNGSTFWESVKHVQDTLLEVLEHRHYDGVEFTREVSRKRNYGNRAVMPVVFTSMIFDGNIDLVEQLGIEKMGSNQTPQVYLDNQIRESNGELLIIWDYVEDLLDSETVGFMFQQFTDRIQSIVESDGEFEVQIPERDKQIIEKYNMTEEKVMNAALHQIFMEQSRRTPYKTAVIFEDSHITYSELDKKSDSMALFLKNQGIGRNELVGVLAQRCIDTIVNVLGILKAGAAYVPIDPQYPEERREYILANSNCRLMLLPDTFAAENLSKCQSVQVCLENHPEDLAYVIYTSGSTGKPKGVAITHQAAWNTIIDINRRFNVNENDNIIGLSSMCFDLSVYDIFGALSAGATIVMIPDQRDVLNLINVVQKHSITIWNSVPSIMDMTVENASIGMTNNSLRLVLLSGDWIPLMLPSRIRKIFLNAEVISLGGATEGAIWSIYYPIKDIKLEWKSIPYGMPLANQGFHIFNHAMELCPVGVPGELYISGAGVAEGYYNDREKTEKAFVNHKLLGRIYKTGDYGVLHKEGYIEFLGRKDCQVKIRGYRVELGEIENCLIKQDVVKNAVVIDYTDGRGNKFLCAYIVPNAGFNAKEVCDKLRSELPEYMIPLHFIEIDEIPLTVNGKVDRKSLPVPDVNSAITEQYQAPSDIVEEKLADICREILDVDRIGINDDFFELGAHSLKVVSLSARVHREFDIELPIREIFRLPSIRKIAGYIRNAQRNIYASICPLGKEEYYPVSSAQMRLFTLNRIYGANTGYNINNAVIIEGKLDRQHLEYVFNEIIKRHESLRTSFRLLGEKPVQIVHEEIDFKISYMETEEDKIEETIESFIRPFDIEKVPLLRIGLVRMQEYKHLLIYDIHHILADGESINIIMRDFANLYNNKGLPQLRIQYKDFAVWQNELFESGAIKNQEEYWLNLFLKEIPRLNMPSDYPRPSIQSFEGDTVRFGIEKDLMDKIYRLTAGTETTLYMVLLAAYNVLLSNYTGNEDIVVGSPISGRAHDELHDIIGMFVNTLPMRNYPLRNKSFREFLQSVKENSLNAYENQNFQYEELVNKLDITRDLGRNPLFDTMLAFQNIDSNAFEVNGLKFSTYETGNNVSKFDIELQVVEKDKTALCAFKYCTRLFMKETVDRLIKDFIGILETIVENADITLKDIELESSKDYVASYNSPEDVEFNF